MTCVVRAINGVGPVAWTYLRVSSYEQAAQRHARRVAGRQAVAVRVSGEYGKTGCWQAYLPTPDGTGRTSYGEQFHVGDGEGR